MEPIAVIKPDMGVLTRPKLLLSPFGALSRAFSEELLARAGFEEGRYPFVPLDLLEEETPATVVQPVLLVDLNLVLEALRRTESKTERERVTERIVERIIRKRETVHTASRPVAAPAARQAAPVQDRKERREAVGVPERPDPAERSLALGQTFYSTVNQHIQFITNIRHMAAPPAESARQSAPGGLGRRTVEFSRRLQLLREEGRPADAGVRGTDSGTRFSDPAAAADLTAPISDGAAVPERPDREGPGHDARILARENLRRMAPEELAYLEQGEASSAYEALSAREIAGTLRVSAERIARQIGRELTAETGRSHAQGPETGWQSPGQAEAARQRTGAERRSIPQSKVENTTPEGMERKAVSFDGIHTARTAGAAERAETEAERGQRETGDRRPPVEPRHYEAAELLRGDQAMMYPPPPREALSTEGNIADTAEISHLAAERPRQTGGALYSGDALYDRESLFLPSAARDIRLTAWENGGYERSGTEAPRGPAPSPGEELAHRTRPGIMPAADAAGPADDTGGPWRTAAGRRAQSTTGDGAAERSGGARQAGTGRGTKPQSQTLRSVPETGGPLAQAANRTRNIPFAREPLRQTAGRPKAKIFSKKNGDLETTGPRMTRSVRDIRTAGEGRNRQTGTEIPQRPQSAAARDIRLTRGPQAASFGKGSEAESWTMAWPAAGILQTPSEAVIYRTWETDRHAAAFVQNPHDAAWPPRNRLAGALRSAAAPRNAMTSQGAAALGPHVWPGERPADQARPAAQSIRARQADRVLSGEGGTVSRKAPDLPPAATIVGPAELIYDNRERTRDGQSAATAVGPAELIYDNRERTRDGQRAGRTVFDQRGVLYAASRAGGEAEPLELAYSSQRQTRDDPGAAAQERSQGQEESAFFRSLPDWAQRFLREGAPSSMTEAARQMSVHQGISTAQNIAAPPVFEQEKTFEWTAPDYRPPAPIEYREKPRQEERPAARNIYISDAEIRRTADRVYQIIEDRIRRERRRMGL